MPTVFNRLSCLWAVMGTALLLPWPAAHAQQVLKPGKWEVTTQSEMAGMGVNMPPVKVTVCVDAKNAGQPPIGAGKECQFSDYKIGGDKASWKMSCSGQMRMSGSGEITIKGESYTGSAQMQMDMGGGAAMSMKSSYSGKRVGDC